MAHQAHNIPWSLLASNLLWRPVGSCNCRAANLHPRLKPNQGKELNHFVEAFVRNIDEHSACERRKYPERYDSPDPNDAIVDEDISKKIKPTVRRWRHSFRVDFTCNGAGDVGWAQLCKTALAAYIWLQVVYCFPEMWDEASDKTDETDYRHAKFYQYMLRTCTASRRTSDVVTYPHRQFSGISDSQFSADAPRARHGH
ncbi:hypothetical protein BDV29DRAFT_152421 [Aspergillus leporis]|uniref:Uncharacterized protein n=1 Tax=Aspergillus leporis TaxID=41062 RepID=A0A5N5XDL1_9EURO|nr:hypothetical protein BDV29DRAFT_152421 [Aspergillus leporis]